MLVASSRFDVPLVFAGLIITGVMGVAMYWVAVTIEERTTGWATRGQQDPRLALVHLPHVAPGVRVAQLAQHLGPVVAVENLVTAWRMADGG